MYGSEDIHCRIFVLFNAKANELRLHDLDEQLTLKAIFDALQIRTQSLHWAIDTLEKSFQAHMLVYVF